MMETSYNPYIVGDPVENNHFYGRHSLLTELQLRECGVIHLLGTRRIGKTSVLKRLEAIQSYTFYINLQRTGGDWANLQRVLQKVVQRKLEKLNGSLDANLFKQANVSELMHALDAYGEEHAQHLWLLFDESEVLIELGRNDIKALQMFQAALWDTPWVKAVFASAKQLSQLDELTSTDEYGTPFLNHLPPPVYLTPLTDDAASQLIRQTQGTMMSAVPEHTLQTICQQTHNHPFYIQWLCHFLWKANPDPATWRVDERFFHITPDLHRMMRYDFLYLSIPERQAIQAILWDTPLPEINPMYIQGLVQLGYLKREATSYAIGNTFFRNWLLSLSDQEWSTASAVSAEATLRLYDENRASHPESAEPTLSSEDVTGQRYGTDRDLTIDDVRTIVARCLVFKRQGGKVTEFYRRENTDSYTLETLRSWLKDKRFRSPDDSR